VNVPQNCRNQLQAERATPDSQRIAVTLHELFRLLDFRAAGHFDHRVLLRHKNATLRSAATRLALPTESNQIRRTTSEVSTDPPFGRSCLPRHAKLHRTSERAGYFPNPVESRLAPDQQIQTRSAHFLSWRIASNKRATPLRSLICPRNRTRS